MASSSSQVNNSKKNDNIRDRVSILISRLIMDNEKQPLDRTPGRPIMDEEKQHLDRTPERIELTLFSTNLMKNARHVSIAKCILAGQLADKAKQTSQALCLERGDRSQKIGNPRESEVSLFSADQSLAKHSRHASITTCILADKAKRASEVQCLGTSEGSQKNYTLNESEVSMENDILIRDIVPVEKSGVTTNLRLETTGGIMTTGQQRNNISKELEGVNIQMLMSTVNRVILDKERKGPCITTCESSLNGQRKDTPKYSEVIKHTNAPKKYVTFTVADSIVNSNVSIDKMEQPSDGRVLPSPKIGEASKKRQREEKDTSEELVLRTNYVDQLKEKDTWDELVLCANYLAPSDPESDVEEVVAQEAKINSPDQLGLRSVERSQAPRSSSGKSKAKISSAQLGLHSERSQAPRSSSGKSDDQEAKINSRQLGLRSERSRAPRSSSGKSDQFCYYSGHGARMKRKSRVERSDSDGAWVRRSSEPGEEDDKLSPSTLSRLYNKEWKDIYTQNRRK